jgi:hypothetical protein
MTDRRWRLSLSVSLLSLSVCATARAQDSWFAPRVSIGGAVEGAGPNFEATVTPWPIILGPHLSVGWSNPNGSTYTYGEIAANFILTAGIGAGSYTADGQSVLRGHFFLGLPIPIVSVTRKGDTDLAIRAFADRTVPFSFLYLEPYWREEIPKGPFGWHAEFGLSLKISIGSERSL